MFNIKSLGAIFLRSPMKYMSSNEISTYMHVNKRIYKYLGKLELRFIQRNQYTVTDTTSQQCEEDEVMILDKTSIMLYDFDQNKWNEKMIQYGSEMEINLCKHQYFARGSKMFVCGGYLMQGKVSAKVYVFHMQWGEIEELSDLQHHRYMFLIHQSKQITIAIGGYDKSHKFQKHCEYFDYHQ